jgi:uncharacterized protein involved in cysteine biosynthesis
MIIVFFFILVAFISNLLKSRLCIYIFPIKLKHLQSKVEGRNHTWSTSSKAYNHQIISKITLHMYFELLAYIFPIWINNSLCLLNFTLFPKWKVIKNCVARRNPCVLIKCYLIKQYLDYASLQARTFWNSHNNLHNSSSWDTSSFGFTQSFLFMSCHLRP